MYGDVDIAPPCAPLPSSRGSWASPSCNPRALRRNGPIPNSVPACMRMRRCRSRERTLFFFQKKKTHARVIFFHAHQVYKYSLDLPDTFSLNIKFEFRFCCIRLTRSVDYDWGADYSVKHNQRPQNHKSRVTALLSSIYKNTTTSGTSLTSYSSSRRRSPRPRLVGWS
jgi:hypothetical protein